MKYLHGISCAMGHAVVLASLMLTVGCARAPQPKTTVESSKSDAQESRTSNEAETSATNSTSTASDMDEPTSSQPASRAPRSRQVEGDRSSDKPDTKMASEPSPRRDADNTAPGNVKKSGDPDAARKNIAALRQKADQAKSNNDPGAAFRLTVAAWDEARLYPNDERLRMTTDELATQIKMLSKQANEKYDATSDRRSTLVEK